MNLHIEDSITRDLRAEVARYLAKDWIKDSHNTDYNRIFNLLLEDADVMTLTFTLQHIRTKIMKQPDNWEFDCATASHLLEIFQQKIIDNKARILAESLVKLEEIRREQLRQMFIDDVYRNKVYDPFPHDSFDSYRQKSYNDHSLTREQWEEVDRRCKDNERINYGSSQGKRFYDDDYNDVKKYFYQELERKEKKRK